MTNVNTSESPEIAALRAQVEQLTAILAGRGLAPLPGMPVHPDDLRAAHEKISADLERRHREHVASVNRGKGFPAPEVGDVFYAWLSKAVRGGIRTREGINFEPGKSVKLEVVADEDLASARAANVNAVTVDGMERVFEDDTLIVNQDPAASAAADFAAERARAEAAESALAAAQKRIAELELAARQGAVDTGDGRPARLPAAAKARAAAAAEQPTEEPKK